MSVSILVVDDEPDIADLFRQRLRRDLPVMTVTAYGEAERRRQAASLGAADFLTKPVDFDYLKEQLRQLPTEAARPGP